MTEPKFQIGQRVRVKPLDCRMDRKDWQTGEVVNYTLHTSPCYVVALDCGLYANKSEGTVFNGCDLEAI